MQRLNINENIKDTVLGYEKISVRIMSAKISAKLVNIIYYMGICNDISISTPMQIDNFYSQMVETYEKKLKLTSNLERPRKMTITEWYP